MDLEELIENFEFLDDWEDRYRYIIEMGRKLEEMPEADKTEANKVRGCTSQVWMTSSQETGADGGVLLHFVADSDAHIVKGLIAILMAAYDRKSPAEALAFDIDDLFGRLGLESHLSFNRRNGFFSMVERIKATAAEAA